MHKNYFKRTVLVLLFSFVFLGQAVCSKKRAGTILPWTRHKGEILVLLGYSDHANGTSAWCDFGGGYEPRDKTIEATARREFKEECPTLGTNYRGKLVPLKRLDLRKIYVYTYLAEVPYVPVNTLALYSEVRCFAWVKAQIFLNLAFNGNRSAGIGEVSYIKPYAITSNAGFRRINRASDSEGNNGTHGGMLRNVRNNVQLIKATWGLGHGGVTTASVSEAGLDDGVAEDVATPAPTAAPEGIRKPVAPAVTSEKQRVNLMINQHVKDPKIRDFLSQSFKALLK